MKRQATFVDGKRLARSARKGYALAVLSVYLLAVLIWVGSSALAEETSASSPDLQVNGYTVFGTNVIGANVVTSGWGSVYIDGSLQVHSNVYVTGTLSSTNLIQVNRIALTKHDQILTDGTTLQPSGSYFRVRGDTTPVTLGNPQIAAGTSGQLITLQGVANTVKVQLVNGNGLRTNLEQPFSLGQFDTIQFIFDDSTTNWVEINRSNNRWGN